MKSNAIRKILAVMRKADNMFNLIEHGDKIVVGLSGGKDSVLLTYALSLYQKFSHTNFTIQPVTLDLGFEGFNPAPLVKFCEDLGLKLMVTDNREVFQILKKYQEYHNTNHLPCSICSRMKKAAINQVANMIGFNKVAFAHHGDDAVETLIMNQIHGKRVATFKPKMYLENSKIEFIRPLILAKEHDITSAVNSLNLPTISSSCPADKLTTREDIKSILLDLYKKYPQAKDNFLAMLYNYEQFDLWNDEIEYKLDQDGLTLKPVTTPSDMYKMLEIRYQVFNKEQGFSHEEEMEEETEKDAVNFLIKKQKEVIGCIRYRKVNEEYKLERFAILKEHRGKGYGKIVYEGICEMIKEKFNPCTITMNAQIQLKDFYIKMGFETVGEEFFEGHVKHIKMSKKY